MQEISSSSSFKPAYLCRYLIILKNILFFQFMKSENNSNVRYAHINLPANITFQSTFWQYMPKWNHTVATSVTRAFYSAIILAPILCQFTNLRFRKKPTEPSLMSAPFVHTVSNGKTTWKNTWKRFMRRQELFNACFASGVSVRNTT